MIHNIHVYIIEYTIYITSWTERRLLLFLILDMNTIIICLFQEKSRNSLKDMYKHNRYIKPYVEVILLICCQIPNSWREEDSSKKDWLDSHPGLIFLLLSMDEGEFGYNLASCDPYVFAYCACKLIFPVSSVSFVYFVSLVFLVSLLYLSCISLPFSPVIHVLSLKFFW